MVMGIYSRVKDDGTTEYAVVNKGTNKNDISVEWLNNAQQPFGWSKDMRASIEKAVEYDREYKNDELTFVGHSKGGAEAAANAVRTNRGAVLLNPMSVNLSGYHLDSYLENYSGNMTAYIVKGDILNNIFGPVSSPIGNVVYLPQQYFSNDIVGYRTVRFRGQKYTTPQYRGAIDAGVQNHLIPAILNGLKEWRGGN